MEIPWEVFAFSFIKVFLYIKEYVLNLECCIFQMEVTGALHVEIFAGDPKTLLSVVAPTFVRIFLTSKRFYCSRYFIINTKRKIA